MRFVQLAVKTVVVFVFCWFPIATCGLVKCQANIEETFLVFGYLNATVTPLVYYSHLRHALKKKLRRLTNRKPLQKSACSIFNSNPAIITATRLAQKTLTNSLDTSPKLAQQNVIAGVENGNLAIARSQ